MAFAQYYSVRVSFTVVMLINSYLSVSTGSVVALQTSRQLTYYPAYKVGGNLAAVCMSDNISDVDYYYIYKTIKVGLQINRS